MSYASFQLQITPSGGAVVLAWPFGTLQSAGEATGVYTDVIGATSPYTNAIAGQRKFFRVIVR
jgi:hypothetical protein